MTNGFPNDIMTKYFIQNQVSSIENQGTIQYQESSIKYQSSILQSEMLFFTLDIFVIFIYNELNKGETKEAMIISVLMFLLMILCAEGDMSNIRFRQVATIPDLAWERVLVFDTDHDGRPNLIFDTNPSNPGIITIWEYCDYDRYRFEDSVLSPIQYAPAIYDVGYLDADSLVDMVGSHNGWPYPLYVFESPDYHSNPTNVVWQDSGFMNIYDGYITDLDQDGLKEILFEYCGGTQHTCVYENTGDNQYTLVWEDTVYGSANFINGDFDLDGRIEFITGGPFSYGNVLVRECVGDNSYQVIFIDTILHGNNYDIFMGNDLDGNGKPEFFFTSVNYADHIVWLYCYEAISNNNFDYFFIDSIAGLPYGMFSQNSVCGDVDADGIEEIVWSTFNQWHIYKVNEEHQYERIYSSAWTQHSVTGMNCYDINGNGYPEVIEMTNPGTIIWEIEGVRLHYPQAGEVLQGGEEYLITWQKFEPPGADSFSLFISYDGGVSYDTIITGLGAEDTGYLWLVPDTVSDSCKIMVWAYGPPRPGEIVPRGVAWDFSDSLFTIVPQGVATDNNHQRIGVGLTVLQNPVGSKSLRIWYFVPKTLWVRIVIYNALGQLVAVVVNQRVAGGIYEIEVRKSLPSGVYFINSTIGSNRLTKKIIILQ